MMVSNCKLLLVISAGTCILPVAHADIVSVIPSVSGSPGAFSYSYAVDNQPSVGLLLFSLTVTGDVGTILAPTGWVTATGVGGPGQTLVEWISTDVPFDIPAFGSLSGFSLTSDSGPGTVAFSTFDEGFSEFDGQTTGPVVSAVPEPNSVALLSTSLIAIYFGRRFALRKRSTAHRVV
jgi:hypothetical protein